jgi:hypothetical protein
MNTTTNCVPLENSKALVSTLDQDKNEPASPGNRILASRQPTRKLSSTAADFGWNDAWILRGIPELDSPMAG